MQLLRGSAPVFRRVLGYIAFFLAGLPVAYILGFRLAGDPHVALGVLGVWLIALQAVVSWGEVRPRAERRGMARPRVVALQVAGLAAAFWVAWVVAVTLPVAFLTDLTAATSGRRVLFLLTFIPLAPLYLAALALVWRRR